MSIMCEPVHWSDEAQEVISGDITTAAAYLTPAGGAVVNAVATFGIVDRDRGMLGFTTSLGFPKKLERIIGDPRVALAYHAREHGFAALPWFVLAQGRATVNLQPSRERVDAIMPQAERYYGAAKRGAVWDRLLREYYYVRVFVDVAVERILAWPSLDAAGNPQQAGPAWPGLPDSQRPPKNGIRPRVDVDRAAGQVGMLAHRVLAYRGGDGYPVVVPVHLAGHDQAGLRLVAAPGLLPPGGRRAGLLAHSYRAQLVGLSTRAFTGWLEVTPDGAVYAPHTSKGFVAPPRKNLLLVSNGLLAKFGIWQARLRGTAERLEQQATEKASSAAGL
ncbi:MAG: hypothetical protein ACTHJW_28610 [Streptosporangiaceae bacterium]